MMTFDFTCYLFYGKVSLTGDKSLNFLALTGLPEEVGDVEAQGLSEQGHAHPLQYKNNC